MEWAKDIPCRYISLYGFCKNENNGCCYNHDIKKKDIQAVKVHDESKREEEEGEEEEEEGEANDNDSEQIKDQKSQKHKQQQQQENNNGEDNADQEDKNEEMVPKEKRTPSKFNPNRTLPFTPFSKIIAPKADDMESSLSLNNTKLTTENIAVIPASASSSSSSKFNPYAQTFTPHSAGNNITLNNNNAKNLNDVPSSTFMKKKVSSNNKLVSNIKPSIIAKDKNTNNLPSPTSPVATINTTGIAGNGGVFTRLLSPKTQDINSSATATAMLNANNSIIMSKEEGSLPLSTSASSLHLTSNGIGAVTTFQNGFPSVPSTASGLPLTSSYLQHHLYAPDPPPHLQVPIEPHQRTPQMLFIPNNVRIELVEKNKDLLNYTIPNPQEFIPSIVNEYFGLVPLNYVTSPSCKCYKVFSNEDGTVCLLYRIPNAPIEIANPKLIASTFSKWSLGLKKNSNILTLKNLFTTTAFNDTSLCFVYDYYPLSITLKDYYFMHKITKNNKTEEGNDDDLVLKKSSVTKDYVWAYLIQIVNAIKDIHAQDLYVGTFNLSSILMTSVPGKIKLFGCGVTYLMNESITDNVKNGNENIKERIFKHQQEDFIKLGHFLQKFDIKEDDPEFQSIFQYLFSKDITSKNVKDLSKLLGYKMLDVVDFLQTNTEYLESLLSKELENDRLFRLICKLNFILHRPEFANDLTWSDNGSKFPIKLFYHFVFHQTDERGKKIMDLTHVLRCLNKLDAGSEEKVLLVTPDEMNCIVITYKELKHLIDTTFRSLI
ncbi:PAN-complex poly(A)-binding subunit PAN3 SCDLUD_003065 [Saccharomycodes ludwigii]|uniref:PAN-complex poly(A)-binding subunit PAN3 n=1 Tax=Saccharomycodes ludwigii TaxID=36035 RepID=UPI001E892926|nr:hypothetical protein SCDLUD_003065 [Saccharomycodes ludwigii]KAH3900098.1 hypothetical protein SCDLUD_003065 [Saccharomycodes ludwigii]